MTNGTLPPFAPVPPPPRQPIQLLPLEGAASATTIPSDRHVRRGQDEYWFAIAALLPQGIAWPRWPDSVLQKTVRGLAGIMGFTDGRAADLLERESDPRQAVEMLDSWETAWGLPDPCWYPHEWTVGERQTLLVQRMTILGAQSREFFLDVATQLSYAITISEYRPFMAGLDRAGDTRRYNADGSLGLWAAQIGPPTMRFAWTVHVPHVRLTWFRASKGQAGTDHHLEIAYAEDLECVIRRWAPAHTVVLFDYSTTFHDPPYDSDHYAQTGTPYEGQNMPYSTPDPIYTPPPYDAGPLP